MTKPTIHLNGSSRETLLGDYCSAMRAVQAALDSLCSDAAPNARDYYPQGDDAFRAARTEHEARIAKLESVHRELLELAESVAG